MFNLQSYLPYLLNRVGFAVTDVFSEALAADDLTVPMWRVLAVLAHHGPQRMSDLADLTSIEISTLSRLLSVMQRRKLLGRKRARNDARVVMVALTERGTTLTNDLIPAATALEAELVAGLEPNEIALLKRTLDKLFANVRSPAAAEEARSA